MISIKLFTVLFKINLDGNYSNVDEGIERIRKMKLNLGYYVYNAKNK